MIHVIIERQVSPDMEPNYEQISREVLYKAYKAEGFLSGETFFDAEKPCTRFVISRWRTIQDWRNWSKSSERKSNIDHLTPVLEKPETVRILTQ